LGKLLRKAGEAETGRITGAKEFKSRRAKRLGWRLRETPSLQMPFRVFPEFVLTTEALTVCSSTIHSFSDPWCNDLKLNDLSFNDLRCNDLPLKRSTRFSTAARLSLRNDAPHIPRFGAALGCAQDWEFLNDED